MVIFMSKTKILFCTGEGLGNVCQTIPAIRTLKEVLGYEIDVWHAFGFYQLPKFIPYCGKWVTGNEIGVLDLSKYDGLVSTKWTKNFIKNPPLNKLPLLNRIVNIDITRSEVDVYMDAARDLGAKEEDLIWIGECRYNNVDTAYDVVIHNGYNKKGSSHWKVKSYPYYHKVAKLLTDSGLSVCSIGSKDEYVKNTDDQTGLKLFDSLGIIKNAGVFLSNDTGTYHCANALGTRNFVIFTHTSTVKNYDPRFHIHSEIIRRDDLDCIGCQNTKRWHKCKKWICRDIDPEFIAEKVRGTYYG